MTSAANIFVAVRVRPPNDQEAQSQKRNVVDVIDDRMLVFDPAEEQNYGVPAKRKYDMLMHKNKDIKFAFDRVFGPECANSEVFDQTSKPLITRLLDGYNCSVFAYGATGAGKTHTMLGTSSHRGIMYHTMVELFEQIESIREEKAVEVSVSYLEIYNEQIKDLLNPGQTLPIREGADGVAYVTDLTLQKPRNAEEVFALLEYGNANRTQHPTDANAESSRSHALFQVYVRQKDKAGGTIVGCHVAKLSLIDLAGSERAIVTRNRGARFREGANINRSLLALGNCINALAEGKSKFVNYRDSKLTRLLKDSLGGNCYTVMIAAVSPSAMWYDDTHNTLQYANRAKNIKVDVTQNVVNVESRLGDYRRIISEQKEEIARLREEVSRLRGGTVTLTKQGANEAAHALQTFESVPDRCRAETRRVTDRLFDLYNQLTKSQQERDRLTALRMDRMRQAQNLMMLAGSTSSDDHSLHGELLEERKQARDSGSASHKAAAALLAKLEPVNKKIEELTKAIESAQQSAVERTRLPETLISSSALATPQLTICRNLARQAWDFSRELCQSRIHSARIEGELRCLKTENGMLKKRIADSDGFIRCLLESIARQKSAPLTGQARGFLLKPASFTAPTVESISAAAPSSFWLSSEPKNERVNDENAISGQFDDESPHAEMDRTVTVKKVGMNRSSSCSGLQQQQVLSLTRSTAALAIGSTSRGVRNGSKQTSTSRQVVARSTVVEVAATSSSTSGSRPRLNRATASASTLPSPFKRARAQINAVDARLGLYSIAESRNNDANRMSDLVEVAEGASPVTDWSVDDKLPRVRKTPVRYDGAGGFVAASSRFAKPSTPQSPHKRPKATKTFRERIFDRFK